ncbi:hypothetical protein G7084_03665 [Weissella coleopterorum]|uniref:Uncharacterized protein n=1 Tax=Weissella coleopterorum TaxID=2714949 RepID=A0A6G8AZV0_9LACO|nr:hypothetical protein [Weissella coleopterorum]QIL50492.1 hypothetical protein G7084_03665 [Weissella coleopterorum]
MKKLDFALMMLVITTVVLNMFVNTDRLMLIAYSLVFAWGAWRYKTEGYTAYMVAAFLAFITVIFTAFGMVNI